MCSGTLTIVVALLWVFLFNVSVFTLGSLKLHSVFQMWCHSMDRNNHFSQPAGYSFAIAAHYAVGPSLLQGHFWLTCFSPRLPNFCFKILSYRFSLQLIKQWLFCARCRMLHHQSLDFVRFLPAYFSSLPRLSRALTTVSTLLWSALHLITEVTGPAYTATVTVSMLEVLWPPAGSAPTDHSPWDQWSSQCSTSSSAYPSSYLSHVVKGSLWLIVS